jgi:hypothetical protein
MREHIEYEEFSKRMHERFPLMFANPYGGFATGSGWYPLIETLCFNIQSHIDWNNNMAEKYPDMKYKAIKQVQVAQIKEKFGTLRFYYDGGNDIIAGMVSMAESLSGQICEECGDKGERRSGGWIRTLCDKHEEERQLIMKEREHNV